MKISYIVYLTENNKDKTTELIKNIKNSTWTESEIILINDRKFSKVEYDHKYGHFVKVIEPPKERLLKYEAYNLGINNSTGDFIRFIEPDDEFVSSIEIGTLETVSNYDVIDLSGSDTSTLMEFGFYYLFNGEILFDRCIFNARIKNKLGYMFEGYYVGVEKAKFLITCWLFGCSFVKVAYDNIVKKVDRPSEEQYAKLMAIYDRKNDNANEMTFIIAFRNEKHEVERTIASMRYMCGHSNITIIDDFSDDEFDYVNIANRYGCTYKRLESNHGSAGTKHYGGMNNDTEYFCFFDAHQRIYHDDLDLILIDFIKKNPDSIFVPRTVYMEKRNDYYINESDYKSKYSHTGVSYCCYITDISGREWDPKWCDKIIDKDDPEKSRVMCILGAVYAMRTDWFRKIRGLEGLTIYGLEESYMSIKTWMLGGACYVLKNIGVGHLYRSVNASPIDPNCVDANRMFLTHVFVNDPETVKKYDDNLKKFIGQNRFNKAMAYLIPKMPLVKQLNTWLNENKVHDLSWVFKELNDKVKHKHS